MINSLDSDMVTPFTLPAYELTVKEIKYCVISRKKETIKYLNVWTTHLDILFIYSSYPVEYICCTFQGVILAEYTTK
jgi:hypothetical protein